MSVVTPASFDTALIGLKAGPAAAQKQDANGDVTRAAKEFEGVFISEMLSHMFEGLQTDPMFGGGRGEEMFRGMLVTEYGKKMSEGKGIGISDQIQKMMIEMQNKMNGV
jgi:Rod binding domain-containing protein